MQKRQCLSEKLQYMYVQYGTSRCTECTNVCERVCVCVCAWVRVVCLVGAFDTECTNVCVRARACVVLV